VHGHRPVPATDAVVAIKELFHFTYWLAHTYARGARPASGLVFDASALPKSVPEVKQSQDQLLKLEAELRAKDEKLGEVLAGQASLTEVIKRLQAEVAAAKKQNAAQPDTHDYNEAETRHHLIDGLLKEAGWRLDKQQDTEFEVAGMPTKEGKGFVDYVLWGDDGKPLGLVEAKRTRRDPRAGQQQAKLYADCLEARFGQRPVIFYSKGYEHWLWDDHRYPPRAVQGFYTKAELDLLIQRRVSRKRIADTGISGAIVERFYLTRAIRRIAQSFDVDNRRTSYKKARAFWSSSGSFTFRNACVLGGASRAAEEFRINLRGQSTPCPNNCSARA
jgi:type I restriction enzyme R subunit